LGGVTLSQNGHITIFQLYCWKDKASVTEWLRSLTSNYLPHTTVGLNPARDIKWGSFPVSLQSVEGSTHVLDCAWILHKRALEFFFHQYSWKIAKITITVLVYDLNICKRQSKNGSLTCLEIHIFIRLSIKDGLSKNKL
jgi:hypothetical protein